MKTKRTNIIAWLCVAGLLFSAQAFAQDFPSYLTMDGTKITDCDKAALPTDLVIPDGVTEISDWAFAGCESLATVSIPASVKRIGQAAFNACTSLANVTIPDGVTEIGAAAFGSCLSIASVAIPASVTKISYVTNSGSDYHVTGEDHAGGRIM